MKTPLHFLLYCILLISIKTTPCNAMIRPKDDSVQVQYIKPVIIAQPQYKGIKGRLTTFIQRQVTAFASKNSVENKPTSKKKRILNTALITGAALLAIYLFQGTIWLTVVALAGLFTYLIGKKIKNRPKPDPTVPIVQRENYYSKRGLRSFLSGLGILVLGFISLILAVATEGAGFLVIGILASSILSVLFFSLAIARSIKALKMNEKDDITPIVVLVLSIMLLLPILLFYTAALIGGF